MKDLAIALVTCDKYAHVWNEWYYAFTEHWDSCCPVYWCGETLECPDDDFIQLYHDPVPASEWTEKLRVQIMHIPQDNIFVWLEDLVMQKNISRQFAALYDWFVSHESDSLRIMGRNSRSKYTVEDTVMGEPLFKVKPFSKYRVSFSPNIYRKEFLLDILKYTESPWEAERIGTQRVDPKRNIFAYHIDGWYINTIVQ